MNRFLKLVGPLWLALVLGGAVPVFFATRYCAAGRAVRGPPRRLASHAGRAS